MAERTGGTEPSGGREPTEAQHVVPRGNNRGLLLGAAVIGLLLVLAVLKPWGVPGGAAVPGSPSAGPAAAASPGPTATPSATPPGYGAPGGQCFADSDWRIFTIETHRGQPQRTWLSLEPGPATGPGDPAVPFVAVVTDRLLALGFCVGSGPKGPLPLTEVRAWASTPAGRDVPVALAPLVASMPHDPDLGAIYRPPPASTGAARTVWAPGRYVFAVRQGPLAGDEWWFGVEVIAAPSASAGPTASAVPGAPAAPGASPAASPAPP